MSKKKVRRLSSKRHLTGTNCNISQQGCGCGSHSISSPPPPQIRVQEEKMKEWKTNSIKKASRNQIVGVDVGSITVINS